MSILLKNCLLHRTLHSLTLTRLAQQRIKEKSISTNSPVCFYLQDAINHCKNTQVIYTFSSIKKSGGKINEKAQNI